MSMGRQGTELTATVLAQLVDTKDFTVHLSGVANAPFQAWIGYT